MGRSPVYLDNAATTAVDPRVAAAMNECLTAEGVFGNPSAAHAYGREAARRVASARREVAAIVGADPASIVFTSGATEAANLALLGSARANADRRRHLVTARTEHRATLDPIRQLEKEGFAVTWLTPDRAGRIDPGAVRAALRPDTLYASIMHVNNETGMVQDIAAIGQVCREAGVLYHCDLAQGIGKLPTTEVARHVDFGSFTAHKIHGPKGVGALYVAPGARPWLRPIMYGGGQEQGLRSGTIPTHQVVGFGRACAIALAEGASDSARMRELRGALWRALATLPDVLPNSALDEGSPAILNVSFAGVEGESLVAGLTDVAVSTGSACNSASGEPSYVLRALGRDTELAQASLRFSLGRWTTLDDIERAAQAVRREVTRLRAVAP
ncbi:MAG TPA: aminotransferase class V-fold PLP-dependent enzyme [Steroidobacteraceae bacterium]|jgi:cysteine desulfurase|nr:aminotransferase class V-fold PLP-dependent enzyme [Steroidobacteraceae bacterium]HNS27744.1 aminotransferase class V-fold PLP-dependent enzyme [Steroidobacteraceae bacterium]